MPKPDGRPLLPGVSSNAARPTVVFQSKRVIRRARLRAILRDTFDLFLLIAVDWFFIHWPRAHVPLLDRHGSVFLLAAVNAALITYVLLARVFPRWRARRVASTWSVNERSRFFTSPRR